MPTTTVDYEALSAKIKLLAHPERLRILDVLRRGQECVCHLTNLFNKPQPYVSQQLSVLRKAGIIEDEKDGLNVYYRLIDEDVARWLTQILGQPEGEHPELTPQKKLLCPCPQCEVEIQLM